MPAIRGSGDSVVAAARGRDQGDRESEVQVSTDATHESSVERSAGSRPVGRVAPSMADIQPLRTLRYDTRWPGRWSDLIAPPYDVIDDAMRAELAARSPFNVVEIDLPPSYEVAAATMRDWRASRACWSRRTSRRSGRCAQEYAAPGGASARRTGFFARVRVEEYGPGRIRPHERTHPGPKEDRLRLTRATRTNLSPIFSLFPDPDGRRRARTDEIAARTSRSPPPGRRPALAHRPTRTLIAELQRRWPTPSC